MLERIHFAALLTREKDRLKRNKELDVTGVQQI
ncbi:hypothetical protein SAMN05444064_115112 [Pseudomonas syringae]|nr:hypothetical protein SAMN05444514_114112 [Pseudomonas syringae]SFM37840.1 hypothetical protein SAMN05444064_115112 [Pseudomonas syringae]